MIAMAVAGLSKKRRRAKKRRSQAWRLVEGAVERGQMAELRVRVEFYRGLVWRHRGTGLLQSVLEAHARMSALPHFATYGDQGVRLQRRLPSPPSRDQGADRLRASRTSTQTLRAVPPKGVVGEDVRRDGVLEELVEKGVLTGSEAEVLRPLRVRSVRELLATFELLPALGTKVDLPRISSRVRDVYAATARRAQSAREASQDVVRKSGARRRTPLHRPDGSPAPVAGSGDQKGPPLVKGPDVAVWPFDRWEVKDQKDRGTCVAFAMAACAEAFHAKYPLSEQFLYYNIKSLPHTQWPAEDGSSLAEGSEALQLHGICHEQEWPYIGHFDPANISHSNKPAEPAPSDDAVADARSRAGAGRHIVLSPDGGNAQRIYDALKVGPVAVCFDVFRWVMNPKGPSNWDHSAAEGLGIVLDPPSVPSDPAMVMHAHEAHAVCVVGYHGDPRESGGGVFVIRNSWGTSWGRELPRPGESHAPLPGYGQVSAEYVERYAFEAWVRG